MRATSNALKQRIANFLGPKPSSPAIYAWNQLGRKVKKGEHGIRILAPVIGVRRKKDEEAEKDIRTQNRAVLVGFRAAYVFDVSQTEGTELPL
jgi:antirestriction protein ArdC